MTIDFIGVGAQKCGTSWVHACLYEHPEICSPVKEIHYFSRDRFSKGREWYESHFSSCDMYLKKGEFSTSYLYSESAPGRIKSYYPNVRLVAIVRNPVERAYSQYRNAIKAGEIAKSVKFTAYVEQEPSVIAQGRYFEQIRHYLQAFTREQLLIMVYEDSKVDPQAFIERIYTHVGVDSTFVPPSLHDTINVARTPRAVGVDKTMHRTAEWLRRHGLDTLVYVVRRSGLPELVRRFNTEAAAPTNETEKQAIKEYFKADAAELSKVLNRDLVTEWNL